MIEHTVVLNRVGRNFISAMAKRNLIKGQSFVVNVVFTYFYKQIFSFCFGDARTSINKL